MSSPPLPSISKLSLSPNPKIDLIEEPLGDRSQQNKVTLASSFSSDILVKIFMVCRDFDDRLPFRCDVAHLDKQGPGHSIADQWKERHQLCRPFGYCAEEAMLFILSRVCQEWRTVVRSTPTLWDTIYLHQPLFLLKAKAPLRGNVPVAIVARESGTLCCGESYKPSRPAWPARTLEWLMSTLPRIKAVDLKLPLGDITLIYKSLSTSTNYLAAMTELSFANRDPTPIDDSGKGPSCWGEPESCEATTSIRLSSIYLLDVYPPPWIASSCYSQLRSLTLIYPVVYVNTLRGIVDILSACKSSLEDAILSFEPAASRCHHHLDPQAVQPLMDYLASQPLIHFPKLSKLEVHHWGGRLAHAFLGILDAPQSTGYLCFDSLLNAWDYFDARPMTAEWGNAIGEYDVFYDPIETLTFAPFRVSGSLKRSSIRHPVVNIHGGMSGHPSSATGSDVGRLTVALQRFVNITLFILNVVAFNMMFAGKRYPDYDKAGRVGELFLDEIPQAGYLDSVPSDRSIQTETEREYDILIVLLAEFPNLQILRLEGLTGKKHDEQYLGDVLSIPSLRSVGTDVICPRLVDLVLVFDLPPLGIDKELYLAWVYRVIASRQQANIAGTAAAIKQVEVFIATSNAQTTSTTTANVTKGERMFYSRARLQFQKMERTFGSLVEFGVLFSDRATLAHHRRDRNHGERAFSFRP